MVKEEIESRCDECQEEFDIDELDTIYVLDEQQRIGKTKVCEQCWGKGIEFEVNLDELIEKGQLYAKETKQE